MKNNKWKKYTSTTWNSYHSEKNPDRKWYQFWKPKYVWVENKRPSTKYKLENGKVTVRYNI